MRSLRFLFPVMTALWVGSAACATNVVAKVASGMPPSDARLEKKITYKAENKALPEVLADISKQTGVILTADQGKIFWSVRQRKVCLYLKDMPLREFMSQLEKLLDYHFSRTDKAGKIQYVLWQDLKARRKEQELIEGQHRKKEEYRQRAFTETRADAERALAMTPEEIEQAKKDDPWLAYLATDPQARGFASIITGLSTEEFNSLPQTGGIPLELLPQDLRDTVIQMAGRAGQDESKLSQAYGKDWKERYGNYTITGISFHLSDPDNPSPDSAGDLEILAKSGKPDQSYLRFGLDTFVIAPSGSRSRLQAAAKFKLMQQGMSEEQAGRKAWDEVDKLLTRAKPPSKEDEQDPDLENPVKLQPQEDKKRDHLNLTLDKLAEVSGRNVMYEHFRNPMGLGYETHEEEKLAHIMDRIASRNHLDWVKDGSTVRFRLKDWAERRSWEIPDEWTAGWLKSIRKNYELSFEELADMAGKLTDAQIEHNFIRPRATEFVDDQHQPELFEAAGVFMMHSHVDFLRFYARLSPQQKAKMWSKEGISLEEVPEDQWPQMLYGMQMPLYGGSFYVRRENVGDPEKECVRYGGKYIFWARDLPGGLGAQILRNASPEDIAKAESEPSVSGWSSFVGSQSSREQVKRILQRMEEERRKAEGKGRNQN